MLVAKEKKALVLTDRTKLGHDFHLTNSKPQLIFVSILAANGDAASFVGNFHPPQGNVAFSLAIREAHNCFLHWQKKGISCRDFLP
jgi:hypothetical protein